MKRTWLLLAVVAALLALGFTSHSAYAQGVVTGVVIDQEGNPVAGARVVIQTAERVRGVRPFVGRFETGEDGVFGWREVPVGVYNLRAGARGYGAAAMQVDVRDGEVTEVEIQLPGLPERPRPRPEVEYGSLTVMVADVNGNPIAGAIVQLGLMAVNENGRMIRRVPLRGITGEDGSVLFAQVPAGNVVACAAARGYTRGRAEVEVVADQEAQVTVTLTAVDPGGRGGGGNGNGRGGRG